MSLSIGRLDRDALENSSFHLVPKEVVLNIFGFLTVKDLAVVARVCKYFNRLSKDSSLDKKIVKIVLKGKSVEKLYIGNLKTCTIQIPSKQIKSTYYQEIFRRFITEHPHLNASYYAFFPHYYYVNSFPQHEHKCISAEKKDGKLLESNEFSLESLQPGVTHYPPEGVNINLLLSKGQRIKFSGSELDQQQLEEEKLMNLWAEHLISQELEKKESTKP